MIISLIAVMTANGVIGRENLIPWYFSEDMYWFKHHTLYKPVIMGRKTFESIKKKPLLDRLNIVLSTTLLLKKKSNDNLFFINTPEKALSLIKESYEVMVIGGSSIYKLFLPQCTRMYLTYIDYIYNHGDTWFPIYNKYEWKLIYNISKLYKNNKRCCYKLNFKIFERY